MDMKQILINRKAQGGLDILTKGRINHSPRSSEYWLRL